MRKETDEQRLAATAYHESGHAVLHYRYGLIPDYVEITGPCEGTTFLEDRKLDRGSGDTAGWSFDDLVFRREYRQNVGEQNLGSYNMLLQELFNAEIMIDLAGGAVEQRYRRANGLPASRKVFLYGGHGDFDHIKRAYESFRGEPFDMNKLLHTLPVCWLKSAVHQYFRRRTAWLAVQGVAEALLNVGFLDSADFLGIVEATGLPMEPILWSKIHHQSTLSQKRREQNDNA